MLKAVTVALDDEFHWMAERLHESIQKNSPSTHLTIIDAGPAVQTKWMPKFMTDNLQKLECWRTWLEDQDGIDVAFLDADLLVLRDLQLIFDYPFDIRYTTRPGRVPFNSGVIFARANPRTRKFFRQWLKHNRRLIKNQGLSLDKIREFAGGNQWAFNEVLKDLEKEKFHCDICTADCATWNCEQETWREFNGKTAIVHIKSLLRGHLLQYMPWESEEQATAMNPLVRTCRAYGW
jgi:hypothetical protein